MELAVRQALNPSLLTQLEDEEEDEGNEEDITTKKGKGKKPVTKKTSTVPNGKSTKKTKQTSTTAKRRSRKLALGEEDAVDETAVGDNADKKRRVSFYFILYFGALNNEDSIQTLVSLA